MTKFWTTRKRALTMMVVGAAAVAGTAVGAVAVEDHGHEIVIKGNKFSPAEETIGVGETLTWHHDDAGGFHSVTADDSSFDSSPGCSAKDTGGCLKEGAEFRHTFKKTGRYSYYSRPHGGPGGKGMSGVVVVVEED